MSLLKKPVLILDCQTTGMHPRSGRILEIGWATLTAEQDRPKIESWILKGPDDEKIPSRIREITGIDDQDLASATDATEVFKKWRALSLDPVVIHYAQFERAFLQNWHQHHGEEMHLEILCSHRIAKKLFPEIPSQNLRGLAGFFGNQLGELKRSSSHVEATIAVWRAIAKKLHDIGIHDIEAVKTWMKEKPKSKKTTRYQYRMDREARLALSPKPGIYRMLAKDGRILYVGKATSLRSRVNSYFRGQKGRDRRKLEMLAQVWDLQVTECETPLEAALLETDEIKKWDPPYNVSLKTGDRRLLFYARDFLTMSENQSEHYPRGPFRPMGILESLRDLHIWRTTGEVRLIFYQEIAQDLLTEGFRLFCEKLEIDVTTCSQFSLRQWLALAARNYRHFIRTDPSGDIDALKEEVEELTALDVAGKFERLLLRSALELRRSRELTQLRNATVRIPTKSGDRHLVIRDGRVGLHEICPNKRFPWAGADIADYDRMSILRSEINKHSYDTIPEY